MRKIVVEQSSKGLINKLLAKPGRMYRSFHRERIRKRVISSIKPMSCSSNAEIEFAFLLCSRDFEMACISAWSLLRFSKAAIRINFYEDGSLQDVHWRLLEQRFPGHSYTSRKEADDVLRTRFGESSSIWKARLVNPLFHKLVDIPVLAGGGRANYSDSDILYFDSPDELLQAARSPEIIAWFNRDIENSYIAGIDELNTLLGFSLSERVNAGLYSVPLSSLNFSMLEQLLSSEPFKGLWKSWRIEQTLFSILTSANGQMVKHLSEPYDVDYFKNVNEVPCKHYVGKIRHEFELEGLSALLINNSFG